MRDLLFGTALVGIMGFGGYLAGPIDWRILAIASAASYAFGCHARKGSP